MDRYKLIILLFLFIASPVHAGMMMMTGDGTSTAACTDANPVGNCTGFLVCQNFETTAEDCDPCTEDNTESWNKFLADTGTITVDYGTALRGSQSCQITSDGSVASGIYITFSAQGTVYGFFRVKVNDGRPSSTNQLMSFIGDGSVGGVFLMTDGKIRVYNGSANAQSTTTLDDGASGTIYVWFYWTKGTGEDGTMGIEVSTTRTFGAWEAEGTTGTATTDMTSVGLASRYVTDAVFDQVLIKTTAIGTVCE
jgi:hypothetical protein